jgi:hypothetical protein
VTGSIAAPYSCPVYVGQLRQRYTQGRSPSKTLPFRVMRRQLIRMFLADPALGAVAGHSQASARSRSAIVSSSSSARWATTASSRSASARASSTPVNSTSGHDDWPHTTVRLSGRARLLSADAGRGLLREVQ